MLRGNSGCLVEIRNGRIVKTSNNPLYFSRLLRQAKKQEDFLPFDSFSSPKIFKTDITQDRCSVEMEYIPSQSFLEYFDNLDEKPGAVESFLGSLKRFLVYEIENSTLEGIDIKVFREKLEGISKDLADRGLELFCKDYINSFEKIEIPVGMCHGDLTLANILFTDKNYFLIDFLDSYIESPLQDVSKIRQDTKHFWTLHREGVDSKKIRDVCSFLDKELDRFFENYEWYCDYYKLFQLFNLLRIFPYSKDSEIRKYLKQEICKIW